MVRALASSGFADTSRVGGGNPELGTLMARYNREALLAALARYRTRLDGLEQLVRGSDWPALAEQLAEADLVEDPLAGQGLGDHTDHKAEHGGAAVEAFGCFQLFGMDLGGGGVEEPTFVGLG